MSIFLHVIIKQTDGFALIRQLEAAKFAGITRVGIFTKSALGYDSGSYEIADAATIIENYIKGL